MSEEEIEKLIQNNQDKEIILSSYQCACLMIYKSNHIKAHIPAWVFRQVALLLDIKDYEPSV